MPIFLRIVCWLTVLAAGDLPTRTTNTSEEVCQTYHVYPTRSSGGLIASLVMGMLEMLYEAVAGAGFWAPVVLITATILRGLQSTNVPVGFRPLLVLLGLMGHMMDSVIFAGVFAWLIAPRLRSLTSFVMGGVVYSLVVFAAMWFGILPFVDPALLKLNSVVFAFSHMMWGAALGLLLAWRTGPALATQTAH